MDLKRIEELENDVRMAANKRDPLWFLSANRILEAAPELLAAAKKCHRLEALVREAREFVGCHDEGPTGEHVDGCGFCDWLRLAKAELEGNPPRRRK